MTQGMIERLSSVEITSVNHMGHLTGRVLGTRTVLEVEHSANGKLTVMGS